MSHHATEDFGIIRSLPEIEIYTPCNSNDAYNLTKNWINSDSKKPTYLRLDKSEFNKANISEIKNGEEKLIELDAYVQELTLEEQFIDIISNDVPKAATITDGQKVLELVL